MPYIITIKAIASPDPIVHPQVVSRRAVVTIEQARHDAELAMVHAKGDGPMPHRTLILAARTLPEVGGTIGPLPDGTMIEILQISYGSLASACALNAKALDSVGDQSQIITAFNEAQMPS